MQFVASQCRAASSCRLCLYQNGLSVSELLCELLKHSYYKLDAAVVIQPTVSQQQSSCCSFHTTKSGVIKFVFFLPQFGHALQQLLTTVPFSEIAGQRYIEWDSQHTCANVMSMLLLHRQTLARLGRHYQTDEQISDALVTNILKGCLTVTYWWCILCCCSFNLLFFDVLYVSCIVALFLHCVRKKVTPCVIFYNSGKWCRILTKFFVSNATSNCKQIAKFQ